MAPWVLPLLFSVGSVGLNTLAAKKREDAINAAHMAERMRQQKIDREAEIVNAQGRDRYEDFSEQQGERKGTLADIYKQATESAPAEPMSAPPPTSSNLVVQSDAAQRAETEADATDKAERRAGFRSFGDLFGDITAAQARDAGDLTMLRGFKRGSQSVLGSELNAASQKGSGMNLLADLFSMGAGVTMPGALIDPKSLAGLYGG